MDEYRPPYNAGFGYAANGGLRPLKSEPFLRGRAGRGFNMVSSSFARSEIICGSDTIAVRFVPNGNRVYDQINDVSAEIFIFNIAVFELTEPVYDLISVNSINIFFFIGQLLNNIFFLFFELSKHDQHKWQ